MSPTPESEEELQVEKQQALLMMCISQDLGFDGGKPVAAFVIYKCLLRWRCFEVETARTEFDRIVEIIASATAHEVHGGSIDTLSYWLSNTSILLTLLLHTPKTSEAVILFSQKLTACLKKIYGMIRDNLKKEISPMLRMCIEAAKGFRPSQANKLQQKSDDVLHWRIIVKSLNNNLKIMKAKYVLPLLVRKVFSQIFSFINVELFNSLLLRRECCSFSNGVFVKAGLAELEQWWCYATEEYVCPASDELKHIREAVGCLVVHEKPKITLKEITKELCPVLSIDQIYRISTMYSDDKYGTNTFSSDVILNMRGIMTEHSNNSGSSSFLLDDDSSIPFSVDDFSKSMPQLDVADVEPSPLIGETSGFVFLHQ